MQDSYVASDSRQTLDSAEPAYRLVIRARIIPVSPPPGVAALPRVSRRTKAIAIGTLAALIFAWVGVSKFATNPTSVPAVSQSEVALASRPALPTPSRDETTAAVPDKSGPQVAPSMIARSAHGASADAPPIEPTPALDLAETPDALPSAIKEVIPDVPQSALRTIRGTVRVAIKVTINSSGEVAAAAAHHRGPSRYFERLSLEAARKWTFTRSNSQAPHTMLVRFYYTQQGATARATALE